MLVRKNVGLVVSVHSRTICPPVCLLCNKQAREDVLGGDEVADQSAEIPGGSYVSQQRRQARLLNLLDYQAKSKIFHYIAVQFNSLNIP